jgi:hypothetical protein
MPAAGSRRDDPRTEDLKVAKVDLRAALTYESFALKAAEAGDHATVKKELTAAEKALTSMGSIPYRLTPPLDFDNAQIGRPDPWPFFSHRFEVAQAQDREAMRLPTKAVEYIKEALRLKNQMYDMVAFDLDHPCGELVNVEGPVEVNGAPQGPTKVTVGFSCKMKLDDVEIEIPNVTWSNVDAGSDPVTLNAGGKIADVKAGGATSVSITGTTNPDPATGDSVDSLVVPIAGDSVDYFIDTM